MSTSPSSETPMELVELSVSEIVPYWRNPRRISDEAVEAVMESIKQYGYQQPIVVDTERVIIMGHTRHAAIRRLGYDRVSVLVARNLTAKQVKELRTIDNRTSEFTRWDFEKLMSELSGLDQTLMMSFFPEVVGPTPAELADGEELLRSMSEEVAVEKKDDPEAEFTCPSCWHSWSMPVSKEDVLSGHLAVRSAQ